MIILRKFLVKRKKVVMKANDFIKRSAKKDFKLRKLSLYKDSAITAMNNIDAKVLDTNNEYLEKLCQADPPKYNILLENIKLANSEEERSAIRTRMAEMKKERYQKDIENKEFCDRQQQNHKHSILQILGSITVVAGIVGTTAYKFKKPLIETVKKLITQK